MGLTLFIQGKVLQVAYAKVWNLCPDWNRTLVSITPVLNNICPTPWRQVSISSAQFLDRVHNQSYKNLTLCVMGLPLDLVHWTALWLLVGIKGRMWECGILTVVSNSETTLYLRINLSSRIVCSSNTEIFHIWILNIVLDLIAFLSLNTVSVYRLNKGSLQRGR